MTENGSSSILFDNFVYRQAASTYDWTKHSCPMFENGFTEVEKKITSVTEAATRKASDTYNAVYLRPRNAVAGAYNTGKEKTVTALNTGKDVAIQTGTVGIGAAVIVSQYGLSLSADGLGLLFDSISSAKGLGTRTLSGIQRAEEAVRKRIWDAINEASRIAKIPLDKTSEMTHSLLDVVTTIIERTLTISINNKVDATVSERVAEIARAVVATFSDKAHTSVIDPVYDQTQQLLDRLSKSLILVDYVRDKREWAAEKVGGLSASVSDLKAKLETEAKEFSKRPEDVLMKSIRSNAQDLEQKLDIIRNKGQEIYGDNTFADGAITYLRTLEQQLIDAQNIYEVRDEVISETRRRLVELAAWVSDMIR